MSETEKTPMPYGSWPSTITGEHIVTDSVSLDEIQLSKTHLYYIERRPWQQGRCVIVRIPREDNACEPVDLLPSPYSARSRVHEYGGGAYCVDPDTDTVYFVNGEDQGIYMVTQDDIRPLVVADRIRFADLVFGQHHRCLLCIVEDHHATRHEPVNSLARIDLETGKIEILVDGYDFFACPRLNPAADKLVWLCWNHPNMPWDGCELWQADFDGTQLHRATKVAGRQTPSPQGKNNIAICEPRWSPDNRLFYISDETGWWRLYQMNASGQGVAVTPPQQDIGVPQWVFAQSNYAFIDDSLLVTHMQMHRSSTLVLIDTGNDNAVTTLDTGMDSFTCIAAGFGQLAFIAASKQRFPALMRSRPASLPVDRTAPQVFDTLRRSSPLRLDPANLSEARPVEFRNRHRQTVYAYYYPPANARYQGLDGEKPPLVVICHGGPTGNTSTALDPKKQYWTSRGFALLDIDYSGSTGYGRDYRRRLYGKWGELDVEDCCDGALHAVEAGLADRNRLVIRGSSAGGYTVLCALTFHDVFSAGASYYGISDLETLATDTHKFEARYLDRLVGPYPREKSRYRQRSPIHFASRLNCPVIFFQGKDDRVVPREQAESMVRALDNKGIAVASRFFDGEQHGFRKAETIKLTLANELYFYCRIFSIERTTDDCEAIEIANFPDVDKPA